MSALKSIGLNSSSGIKIVTRLTKVNNSKQLKKSQKLATYDKFTKTVKAHPKRGRGQTHDFHRPNTIK